MANISWILTLYTVLITVSRGLGDPASQKIYTQLQGENICFRRLNATHQAGCTSKGGGSVGILQIVETKNELLDVLENGQFYPYVIALNYKNFSSSTLRQIQASGKANGVLILFADEKPDYEFSPDQTCPNANFGMYRGNLSHEECGTKWNPVADGTLFESWDFPIFAVRDKDDINEIKKCYKNFSSPERLKAEKWPLCAAELRSYMLAAKDAKTCIRRSKLSTNIHHTMYCRPLGDQNIWSTLKPLNKSEPVLDSSMIVVAARLDAASMFDGIAPGADSTVTGLVALLAIAEVLSKFKDSYKNKNVMFVLFNGESFDYIGSSKMVYEMEQKRFPTPLDESVLNQPALIHLNSIGHFIELSQLSGKQLFVHSDVGTRENATVNTEIDKIIKSLETTGKAKIRVKPSKVSTLPPASLQSFLHKNRQIAGVVLSNYDDKFKNKNYNSMFDVGSTISDGNEMYDNLANVASAVAETIHFLGTNESKTISINSTMIRDLCMCYLNASNCTLFRESIDSAESAILKNFTYPLYVSVDPFMNSITKLTMQLLAYLTGERLNGSKSDCKSHKEDYIFRYIWMEGSSNKSGICVKTAVNYSRALSPAFEIDGYDFDSGEYSTWTESEWEQTSIRIFLKPSKAWEVTVLMTGIVVFIFSFICVWMIDRNAKILFPRSQVGL